MNRLLRPILLCLLVALALGVAACGGSDGGGKEASSDTDVDTLLADTFNGKDKKVESGKLDLSLKIDAKNTEGVSGPVTVSVKGPFQTEGKQKLPKFKIDFAFEGAGQSIKAGLTSTGTKGFVNFQGSDYVVTDQIFKQFKTGYEQAQKKGNTQNQSLSSLGLDPRKWLTNAKNEGEAKVGDDDVIKITGGVDVNKLLDDVNKALTKARDLGVQGTQSLPSQLTRRAAQAGRGRRQGPEGRDLHGQGRLDPAPHGRVARHRRARRAPARPTAPPTSSSTSRSPTSTRTRRSPSRRTRSRSTSSARSSAGWVASAPWAARRRGRRLRLVLRQRLFRPGREQREAQEVLEVRHRCRLPTPARRRSAPTCSAP